ncbi:hypothetical protein ILYODFUR_025159 [Ilyodon furcidens]|uniref:Uncharacterized protein n=1 Tax=Ilyodon furcidens TaxID=33524 RepID=A0ABV0SP47_9TELE
MTASCSPSTTECCPLHHRFKYVSVGKYYAKFVEAENVKSKHPTNDCPDLFHSEKSVWFPGAGLENTNYNKQNTTPSLYKGQYKRTEGKKILIITIKDCYSWLQL